MPRRRDAKLLEALGARLAVIRRQRGWTQEALSEAVGIEPVTLSRLETGDRALSLSTLAAAAGALGVSLGDLVDVERLAPAADVPADEAEVLRVFRALDEAKRDLALRVLREVGRR